MTNNILDPDMDQKFSYISFQLKVTDFGSGIPNDQLKDLFLNFSKLEMPRKNNAGDGLGVSISKSIIEHMGGSVCVKSKVGHGTTFCICLNLMCKNDSMSSPFKDKLISTA